MGETVRFVRVCRRCAVAHGLWLDPDDVRRWESGEYVQDVWPDLSADDRELLISGTCGPCFDQMFADDEEEGE